MSRELKLGLLSILVLALGLWGYQYIKGKNLLNKLRTYQVVYSNVEGLEVAAPVEINGYNVGSVQKIQLNPEDVGTMLVTFEVEGDYLFNKSTQAALSNSNSLVGSKKINLLFDALCTTDCLQDGDRMVSAVRGILETILPKNELKSHLGVLREEMGGIMDSVMSATQGEDADNAFANSLKNLEQSMNNLASLTSTMDRFTRATYTNLETTIGNMASITESLEKSSGEIKTIMNNVTKITDQIAVADLGSTINKADETFALTNTLLTDLKGSLGEFNTSFEKIDGILGDIENGKGTLGMIMKDEALYNNLNLLMQDFRLHPKRYVRFSVFGRKGNAYEYPEGDPALEAEMKKN